MTAQTQEAQYFDLHTSGIGYLNRVRMVTPNKGPEYLACSISALRGNREAVEYTPFELRVSGTDAKEVIASLEEEANDRDTRVLISFRVGDAMPEAFTYKSGDRKGQTGVSLRGRLIKVFWVKVNGEYVYQAPKAEDTGEAAASNADADGEDEAEDAVDEAPQVSHATRAAARSTPPPPHVGTAVRSHAALRNVQHTVRGCFPDRFLPLPSSRFPHLLHCPCSLAPVVGCRFISCLIDPSGSATEARLFLVAVQSKRQHESSSTLETKRSFGIRAFSSKPYQPPSGVPELLSNPEPVLLPPSPCRLAYVSVALLEFSVRLPRR